ncbi:Cytochrome c oxidase assembly protein COX19 [Rhodotorula toruloides]|nr:Cytochrome c oxidase assembly protein COX19 [Rhodotorula toruloides]
MSFGRPSNTSLSLGGAPPLKGSFPLDHDGECKDYMVRYLKCMKQNKNQSTECRYLSKEYLACRMDKGLMERTDFEALGFQEGEKATGEAAGTQPTAQAKHQQPPTAAR